MKLATYGSAAVVSILAGAVIYFGTAPDCTETKAIGALQAQIAAKLKSPSTAVFQNVSEVKTLDSCFYLISGTVDSQNGFGAVVRTKYGGDVNGTDYAVVKSWVGKPFQ